MVHRAATHPTTRLKAAPSPLPPLPAYRTACLQGTGLLRLLHNPIRAPPSPPRCRVGTHQELRVSVPNNLTLGQLCRTLRDRLEVHPSRSLVYYVGRTVVAPSCSLATLYHQHAHVDSFLYITFSEENTLG